MELGEFYTGKTWGRSCQNAPHKIHNRLASNLISAQLMGNFKVDVAQQENCFD